MAAAGPLMVTVELDVTVDVVSDVTATVTVLVPEPVTVAFSGICAVPRGVTENCEAGLDSEAVTGPVVPVIWANKNPGHSLYWWLRTAGWRFRGCY